MRCNAFSAAMVLFAALSLPSGLFAQEDEVELLRSDSSAPYVHRITLYDHDGTVIDPRDELARPYSPKMTCGKCHSCADVSAGWHFNAPNEALPAGRLGEPWLLVDPQTGTQLPVSGRKWPGTFTPQDAGLTNWQFVMMFGHHTPGGGFGEPSDERLQNSPERLRWGISGKLEIDCMFCHSADQQHDPAEAARQIEKQNFKWTPTAALGLAVVRGSATEVPDDWDPLMPPDPAFPEPAGPQLVWDLSRFDADDRVLFNIGRRPPTDRCYFCHSFREIGSGATPEFMTSEDVHLAAGLTCVDCHRHGIDHMMVRGYETEATERGEPELATFSCKGCHLGVEGAADPLVALGGRYGAPYPEHPGLPPLHLDKLTCTACHSGPWPEMNTKRFQTARAHGLGLPTRERTDDDPPRIVGPVFARQHDGKIAPQRLAWETQRANRAKTNVDDAERDIQHYRWPIAHNVRPASQSLGVGDCTDCHTEDGPIFFGRITDVDDPAADTRPLKYMYQLRGDDVPLAKAWASGFGFRPAFTWFGFVCAALVGLILLHYVLAGVDAITRRFR